MSLFLNIYPIVVPALIGAWAIWDACKPETTRKWMKVVVAIVLFSVAIINGINWYNDVIIKRDNMKRMGAIEGQLSTTEKDLESANQEIAELKKNVSRWTLNDEQRKIILETLKNDKPYEIEIQYAPEVRAFAIEFEKTIREAGWEVRANSGWSFGESSHISFVFKGPGKARGPAPKAITILLKAFKKAGLIDPKKKGEHFSIEPWDRNEIRLEIQSRPYFE
jgi:hypothetical protein